MQTNPDSPAYYATDGTIYKDGEFALSGALTGNWNALIFATHNSSKESDEVPPLERVEAVDGGGGANWQSRTYYEERDPWASARSSPTTWSPT